MSLMSRFRPLVARVPQVQRGFTSSTISLRKKKADTGYPEAPKRPPTAFAVYQSEFFAKKREELGDPSAKLRITEYSREASDAWKALPEDVKERYNAQRAADADKWERAYREWYEALDADAIAEIEAVKGKTLSFPGGKAAYKREQAEKDRQAGVPPKPITPFFEFTNEFRSSSEARGLKPQEVTKEAGAKWAQMSDADKQRFKDIAEDKKAKYKAWEAETA